MLCLSLSWSNEWLQVSSGEDAKFTVPNQPLSPNRSTKTTSGHRWHLVLHASEAAGHLFLLCHDFLPGPNASDSILCRM